MNFFLRPSTISWRFLFSALRRRAAARASARRANLVGRFRRPRLPRFAAASPSPGAPRRSIAEPARWRRCVAAGGVPRGWQAQEACQLSAKGDARRAPRSAPLVQRRVGRRHLRHQVPALGGIRAVLRAVARQAENGNAIWVFLAGVGTRRTYRKLALHHHVIHRAGDSCRRVRRGAAVLGEAVLHRKRSAWRQCVRLRARVQA